MDKTSQLIANSDFALGLADWRLESGEVSLVVSAREHMLRMLAAEDRPARVVGAPAEVLSGATYALTVRRSAGEATGTIGVFWLDEAGHEVSHIERSVWGEETQWDITAPFFARFAGVLISCTEGEMFLRSVTLKPVGHRAAVSGIFTSLPVLAWESQGTLYCEVQNTGSEKLSHPVVELRLGKDLLAAGAEPSRTLPVIQPGEYATAEWPLAPREPGVYGVQTRVRAGGLTVEAAGNIVVGDDPIRGSAAGGGLVTERSYVSLSTRTFRLALPRMEFGFGTGQLDFGDPLRFGGWIRSMGAAIADPTEPPRMLFGRRTRVAGTTLVLYNSDPVAEWEITLNPGADRHHVSVLTRYTARIAHTVRALEGICVCLGDQDTPVERVATSHACGVSVRRGDRQYAAILRWQEPAVRVGRDFHRRGWLCSQLLPPPERLGAGRGLSWQQDLWVGPLDTPLAEALRGA